MMRHCLRRSSEINDESLCIVGDGRNNVFSQPHFLQCINKLSVCVCVLTMLRCENVSEVFLSDI